MSYLAGPMTSEQIKKLVKQEREAAPDEDVTKAVPAEIARSLAVARPMLDPGIDQFFVPADVGPDTGEKLVYVPYLIAAAQTSYARARPVVNATKEVMLGIPAADGPLGVDWDAAMQLGVDVAELDSDAEDDAAFADCPPVLSAPKKLAAHKTRLKRWIRAEQPLVLLKSSAMKIYSEVDESERDFRIRLQQLGNEQRDRKAAVLKRRYERRVQTLRNRLLRAEQAVAREAEQARGQKIDTALSFGTAVLGALLGRKVVSSTSATRVGSAIRKAGKIGQQAGDVRRAKAVVAAVQEELAELERQFDDDVAALDDAYDAMAEELSELLIRPRASDIEISAFGVGWLPFYRDDADGMRAAYRE